MVKHMKHKGRPLSKPNIAFQVRAKGQSYLEWAEDVHRNSFLAQKWKWKELVDAAGTAIQTNEQYYTNRRGELVRLRWEGQTESQLVEAEAEAATEDKLLHDRRKTADDASGGKDVEQTKETKETDQKAKVQEEKDQQAKKDERASLVQKAERLFDKASKDTSSDGMDRSELKKWLLSDVGRVEIENVEIENSDEKEPSFLTRMNIFESMQVRDDKNDMKSTPDRSDDDNEKAMSDIVRGDDGAKTREHNVTSRFISKSITKTEFVELCAVDRKYLLPFEVNTLVDLDDALRDFGDKLLAIFCDVVKGVVNSDGWFLFPAGRRPRHQLIGDTIDKYGGDLDDCVMVQYNSLQNAHMLARGQGGTPEDADRKEDWSPPDMDHETFVEKLKDFSKEILPFSKETPEVDERLVYPSEDELYLLQRISLFSNQSFCSGICTAVSVADQQTHSSEQVP